MYFGKVNDKDYKDIFFVYFMSEVVSVMLCNISGYLLDSLTWVVVKQNPITVTISSPWSEPTKLGRLARIASSVYRYSYR